MWILFLDTTSVLDQWPEYQRRKRFPDRVGFSGDWLEPFTSGRLHRWRPTDPERVLNDLARPVVILHGELDMCLPVQLARRLHPAVRDSQPRVVNHAGHMVAQFRTTRALGGRGDCLPSGLVQRGIRTTIEADWLDGVSIRDARHLGRRSTTGNGTSCTHAVGLQIQVWREFVPAPLGSTAHPYAHWSVPGLVHVAADADLLYYEFSFG